MRPVILHRPLVLALCVVENVSGDLPDAAAEWFPLFDGDDVYRQNMATCLRDHGAVECNLMDVAECPHGGLERVEIVGRLQIHDAAVADRVDPVDACLATMASVRASHDAFC